MPAHEIQLQTVDGQTLVFPCSEDQDVLTAAQSQDIHLQAQCRAGACGLCLAHAPKGQSYTLGPHDPSVLTAAEGLLEPILLCQTYPQAALSLHLPYPHSHIRFEALRPRLAHVVSKTALTSETMALVLQLTPDEDGMAGLDFEPGQFVELAIPGTDIQRAYSLANAPNWEGRLAFLIRLRTGGAFSRFLKEEATPGMPLQVHGPLGSFCLQDSPRPRVFVAGGCGLASVWSMLERVAEWQLPESSHLLFGLWHEEEVFYASELADLKARYPLLSYEICIESRGDSVIRSLEKALDGLPETPDIYICGSAGLVDRILALGKARGIPDAQIIYERYARTQGSGAVCATDC